MKAIVANVLFGGTLGCLGWASSAMANPKFVNQPSLGTVHNSIISANLFAQESLLEIPQAFGLIDRVLTISDDESDSTNFLENSGNNFNLPSGKKPSVYDSEEVDLVLGFQNTFWPSTNPKKYWGLTTVEHWGQDGFASLPGLSLSKLSYTDSSPVLPLGSSSLTFSGGGNKDLVQQPSLNQDNFSPEFEEFRGGITYHRGVANQLTLGVGFIYEDNLGSFAQFTYDSDILPIRTTFSLLTKKSQVDLHSHVRFQPAPNFVVNYHNDQEKQKFDLDWEVASNFSLVAKGNTKQKSHSTGVNFAVKNSLISLNASAAIDNNYNLQWKVNSQIGGFKLAYSTEQKKSSSELSTNLLDSETWGWQCAAYVKYQTKIVKQEQQDFVVWGGKLHSADKIRPNKHLWSLDLGYGTGIHGNGLIINGSVALKPNLSLKLDYQEIAAGSDDTKIKLQLSSD